MAGWVLSSHPNVRSPCPSQRGQGSSGTKHALRRSGAKEPGWQAGLAGCHLFPYPQGAGTGPATSRHRPGDYLGSQRWEGLIGGLQKRPHPLAATPTGPGFPEPQPAVVDGDVAVSPDLGGEGGEGTRNWVSCFLFFFFRATPSAHGGSQARGRIGAAAASLHYSHSNVGSKPRL